jgi:flagellar M-ring protein FliF
MLDQALGPNRSVVRASVSFNWDQKQVNSETYAPRTDGAGVLRSEQNQEESFEGAGALPGGVPGVDSNTAPTYPTGTNTEASKYTKSNTTRNYEVSKVVQTVTQAPGTLQRISVAVMLDETLAEDQSGLIESMVAAAAGVDTSRGDAVVVQRVPFEATQAAASDPMLADVERRTAIMNAAKLAGLLIALLILMRFAYLTFRDLSRRLAGDYVPYVAVVEDKLPAPTGALQLPGGAGSSGGAPELAAPQAMPELPPLADSPVAVLRKQLMAVATRDPEAVADLVQSWLTES